MSNILKKNNILDIEDNYNTENKGAKEALLNLLNKLPSLSAWAIQAFHIH